MQLNAKSKEIQKLTANGKSRCLHVLRKISGGGGAEMSTNQQKHGQSKNDYFIFKTSSEKYWVCNNHILHEQIQ